MKNNNVKYPWEEYGIGIGSLKDINTMKIVLYISQMAALIVLTYLSSIILGPLSYAGISFFYFVYGFNILFTMWWGFWGALGSYIGGLVGGGLMLGVGIAITTPASFSDFVPFILAFLVYRGFLAKRGIDPFFRDLTDKEVEGVKTSRAKAWAWFIILNGIVFNFIASWIGVGVYWWLGLIPPNALAIWYAGWFFGNLGGMIVVTPILAKSITPIVRRTGLITKGWIN